MARLLFLLFLLLAVLAMAALAFRAVGQALRGAGRSTGRTGSAMVAPGQGGETMQKIAFAALILLLVGVTSGLIGGL